MNAKQRAVELYAMHIALATTDGKLFRKTIMDTLQTETGCTLAAAATHYNNAKKNAEPVQGLGRPVVSKNVRKPGNKKAGVESLQDDNDCFTVIELLKHNDGTTVGRCASHLMQGDASEDFDERIKYLPSNTWIMIQGLGPLSGDNFKLSDGETEVKRYTPQIEAVVAKSAPLLVD